MRLAGVAVGTVVSIGSAPMAAALVERAVDRQPLSRRWAAGAAVGVLGMLVLAVARAGEDGPTAKVPAHGRCSSLRWVCWPGRRTRCTPGVPRVMRRGVPSRPVMGAVFGAGGVLLLPVLLLTGAPIVASWPNAAAVTYLAVVPMFLGYALFGRGLAAVSASTATALSLLEPAVAAVIAVLVLGERLPTLGWMGMAVLLASLVVLTAPSRRQRTGRAAAVSARCRARLIPLREDTLRQLSGRRSPRSGWECLAGFRNCHPFVIC